MNYKYEAALSFAREERVFAEAVADGLRKAGIEVFYDGYYASDLWGEDLSVKLREVYHAESRYCIMILSDSYLEKMWTNFERQQAIERLIQQKGTGYVLPVRLDGFDRDVPGLSNVIGYLSASSDNPEMVVDEFLKKIGKQRQAVPASPGTRPTKSYIPRLTKGFTDKEKDQFLRNSFEEIVNLIDRYAAETHEQYPHFEYEMETVTSRKVIFTIYQRGEHVTRFKIWLGGMVGQDTICFLHGSHVDIDRDDSFNEYISLEEHENELKLKVGGISSLGTESDRLMSPKDVAEYLWKMACVTLT